jgi:hypothetical protein
MLKRKNSRLTRYRLGASFRVAFIVAAVAFVALAVERPWLVAAPADARVNDTSMYMTDAGGSPMLSRPSEPSATSESPLPKTTSESAPVYFPSQFAPPSGDMEPQPPTF